MPYLIALLALFSTTAHAVTFTSPVEQVPTVELFTSQGCSSCPPADRWLSRLVEHPDLWKKFVPMAFHVDYWDYIGWKDRFADPRNSNRQRYYQQSGGIRSVYTPGFVVDGREWRGFFRGRMPEFKPGPKVGRLHLEWHNDGHANVRFNPARDNIPRKLELRLAILGFGLNTPIGRGENAGKALREDFVVLGRHRQPIEVSAMKWQLPLPETVKAQSKRRALVAWLTESDSPAPIQAVGGWLP